jgi:hypothetical protein
VFVLAKLPYQSFDLHEYGVQEMGTHRKQLRYLAAQKVVPHDHTFWRPFRVNSIPTLSRGNLSLGPSFLWPLFFSLASLLFSGLFFSLATLASTFLRPLPFSGHYIFSSPYI